MVGSFALPRAASSAYAAVIGAERVGKQYIDERQGRWHTVEECNAPDFIGKCEWGCGWRQPLDDEVGEGAESESTELWGIHSSWDT